MLVLEFTPELAALAARGVRRRSLLRRSAPEVVVAGEGLPLRPRPQRRPRRAAAARLRRARRAARRGRLVVARPPALAAGEVGRGARCWGGRRRSTAWSSPAKRAAARSASRPRTSRSSRGCSSPRFGIYAGAAAGTRGGLDRDEPALRRRERRIEAFLLDFEGDLYGERLVVELWRRLRDERAFESEAELVEQIARDVEETRARRAPLTGRAARRTLEP